MITCVKSPRRVGRAGNFSPCLGSSHGEPAGSRARVDEMLELWGGVECSVVRIRSAYRDQVAETGHSDRIEDLDAIAGLGIGRLRYPILWEHVAPADPENPDWSWHDARLQRLHRLGIRVIAGLAHHGRAACASADDWTRPPTRLPRDAGAL